MTSRVQGAGAPHAVSLGPESGWRGVGLSRLPRGVAVALGGALAALLLVACALDPEAPARLLNRFHAIHVVLGAALLAGLLSVGVGLAAGTVAKLLGLLELLQRTVVGAALVAGLPFAQASDPSAGRPEASQRAEPAPAESEIQGGLYVGGSITPRSDVHFKAPDGTDITLKKVQWKAESLVTAIYYGARGIDWSARLPRLGVMVDFTHAKATAIRSQKVAQSGKRMGRPVPPMEPITRTFRKLEFTHGLNFLTINGVYRFTGWRRRAIPYVGLGIGFVIPHAEVWRAGQPKSKRFLEAVVTGLATQVFGGIEWKIFVSDRYSAISEYKLTYTTNDVHLHDGGHVEANLWVNGFNFGVYRTMWRQSDMALE